MSAPSINRQRPSYSGRLIAWLAVAGTARRRATLIVCAVVVLGSLALIPGLEVSTSRFGLVDGTNPYQARLHRFLERFGALEGPVVVVSGSDAEARRRLVDDLVARLEEHPALADRVIARVGPEELAELLVLHAPQVLPALEAALDEGETLSDALSQGLVRLLELGVRRLETQAVALQVQLTTPMTAGFASGGARELLVRLAEAANTASAVVDGSTLESLPLGAAAGELSGLDEQGYLAAADGSFHVIAIFPDLPNDEVAVLAPVVEFIRAARDAAVASAGSAAPLVRVTGIPTLAVDELGMVERGLRQSGGATAAIIIVLFLLAFRSLRQTLLAGIPLVVGLLATLAFARLVYGQLNLITSNFVSLLLGLGIDFAVHTLARYNEQRRHGDSPVAAVEQALRRTGPGILVGAATTALAFLTTTTTEFTAFAELGVITAFGLLAMLLATVLVLPPVLLGTRGLEARVPPELPGLGRLASAITRMPLVWLALGVTAGVAGAVSLTGVGFNARYFDFLPRHTESASALLDLERDPLLNPSFANVTAESLEEAREMADRLRQSDAVARVLSPADAVPSLDPFQLATLAGAARAGSPSFEAMASAPIGVDGVEAVLSRLEGVVQRLADAFALASGRTPPEADRARNALTKLRRTLQRLPEQGVARLSAVQRAAADVAARAWRTAQAVGQRGSVAIEDLPAVLQLRFASHDRNVVALYVFPAGDPWDTAVARRFVEVLESVDPEPTGFAITTHRHEQMILRGFIRAALIAAVLVFAMLLMDFRSLRDALLAMLPVAFGGLWMLAAMSGLELSFDVANIVVLPLVFGIGVDAGVHVVHRTRESEAEVKGAASLADVLRGTGGAVALASITTMAGFGGLMMADYGGMKSLGALMMLGVGACMLASLVILPATLVLLRRAR